MSIGVLAIGLLGVAALIPLAHHQAHQGVLHDRASAAGKRAFREFKIRDMSNPENWIGQVAMSPTQVIPQAYCIDPQGLLAMGSATFPAVGGNPFMQRITLASQPRTAFSINSGGTMVSASPIPMPASQATEVFVIQDDLDFQIPDEAELPPEQTWLVNGSKRYAEGNFSWFATLVPDVAVNTDMFTLSLVVVNQRVLPKPGVPVPNTEIEQVAQVTFLGGGMAGGDVQLTSALPIKSRVGDWIMLGQTRPVGNVFRWYRILAVDERDEELVREMTLHGPDWDANPSLPTQATLIPGVIAVFEKTVRLETSSLWAG